MKKTRRNGAADLLRPGFEPLEDRRLLAIGSFPAPLVPVAPLGSLIHDGAVEAEISVSGEVDGFTIDLDGGQTVAIMVEADAALQPSVLLTSNIVKFLTKLSSGVGVKLLQGYMLRARQGRDDF